MAETGLCTGESIAGIALSNGLTVSACAAPQAFLLLLAAVAILSLVRWLLTGDRRASQFEIDQAEVGIGDTKVTFRPNMGDREVAYKVWVEISTRKIGLPIDLEHDVISEVYDSWYAFFQVTRELLKEIPINKVRTDSTRKIIGVTIAILNDGLRPHLTKWQARFRRWADQKLNKIETLDLNPQDIQKDFPGYEKLSEELLEVNRKLMIYRARMYDLVTK